MKTIGLLSDTHGTLHERVFHHFADCDEIWHAGDIGTTDIIDQLEKFKPLRAVFGNIDGSAVRKRTSENLIFTVEGLKVYITHIGGYPGKYDKKAFTTLQKEKPGLFICGHSHILKVQFDSNNQWLCMNPGAAGNIGWHTIITLLKFQISQGEIKNLQAIELGKRSKILPDELTER
mgnify:CR=1 FL=1